MIDGKKKQIRYEKVRVVKYRHQTRVKLEWKNERLYK